MTALHHEAATLGAPPATHPLGDPDGWIADHGDALLRFAMVRVNDLGVAEDLVQETLIAAWRGRERFAGECSPRTWMVGILKRRVADHFRQNGRSRLEAEAFTVEVSCPAPTVERMAESRELRKVIEHCSGELPPHLGYRPDRCNFTP